MFSPRSAMSIARVGVRSFSTTPTRLDLARVTLLGRLGNDIVIRKTADDKEYAVYAVATATGSGGPVGEDGVRPPPPTSWHTIWNFNPPSLPYLQTIGKGSTVHVECDLQMKPAKDVVDGKGREVMVPSLYQRSLTVVNKIKPEGEESEGSAE